MSTGGGTVAPAAPPATSASASAPSRADCFHATSTPGRAARSRTSASASLSLPKSSTHLAWVRGRVRVGARVRDGVRDRVSLVALTPILALALARTLTLADEHRSRGSSEARARTAKSALVPIGVGVGVGVRG